MDELTWRDVRSVLDRDPRLILPVGALEQHGPHLPLGSSTLIAERVAEALSERLSILRAPTFSYGVTASTGPYAGAAGLRRKTMHRAVNELLARWEDQGVQEFAIVTAHRYEPHLEGLLMALTATAATTVYDLYQIEVRDLLDSDPELEHGGELETSLMLHLAPDRVHEASARAFAPPPGQEHRIRGRMPDDAPGMEGASGRADLASRDKGRAVFERWVATLVHAMDRGQSTADEPG